MTKIVLQFFYILCLLYNSVQNEETIKSYHPPELNPFIETEIIDVSDDMNNMVNAPFAPSQPYNGAPTRFTLPINEYAFPQGYFGNDGSARDAVQVQNTQFRDAKTIPQQSVPNQQAFQPYPYTYNQYPQTPYTYPYAYPQNYPYLPGYYLHRYFPDLYQYFPNGLFVLPENIDISNGLTEAPPKQIELYTEEPRNTITLNENHQIVPSETGGNNVQQSNITNFGTKHQTFTSNVELKPVSTVLTRFKGPDGKTHVKLITSDGDGNEKVSTSETGDAIDLKITNGVLEKPNNATESTDNREVTTDTVKLEAENDEEGNGDEYDDEEDDNEDQDDDAKPIDVLSWIG